jgi:hypothetical protein
LDHLRAAESLAERLNDPQRLGWIACYLCSSFSFTGEHDRAIAAGQRALALATTSGAFDAQVAAQMALGMTYISTGDFRQALDISQRVMASLTGDLRYAHFGQAPLPAVVSRSHLTWSLAELGGFAEGCDRAIPNALRSLLPGVNLRPLLVSHRHGLRRQVPLMDVLPNTTKPDHPKVQDDLSACDGP